MVADLNQIIDNKDFSSEEDSKSLVFICANNQDLDVPFALLADYPVFDAYAEYWEKSKAILKKNKELLDELYRPVPETVISVSDKEKLSRASKLILQKKAIKKYLKNYPTEKF
jgi:hypothetical protein